MLLGSGACAWQRHQVQTAALEEKKRIKNNIFPFVSTGDGTQDLMLLYLRLLMGGNSLCYRTMRRTGINGRIKRDLQVGASFKRSCYWGEGGSEKDDSFFLTLLYFERGLIHFCFLVCFFFLKKEMLSVTAHR